MTDNRFFDPKAVAGARLDAPAFHRNHAAIWALLERRLANASGDVLEAGSGTGQHVVEFARKSPHLTWWPADYDPRHVVSIDAWRAQSGLSNIRPARRIDLSAPGWDLGENDSAALHALAAIFCANVIHIAPWNVAEGLFAGAGARLKRGGKLFLYGPFKRDGEHTAPSNATFDASLRAQNAEWGVRDLADVTAVAADRGLSLIETEPMPANNLTLIFEVRG